jgi:hypothetical protein
MKICWDNIEHLRLTRSGNFRFINSSRVLYYRDSCKNCGEPFLGTKSSNFCCQTCMGLYNNKGEHNPMYGKKHKKSTISKMIESKMLFHPLRGKNLSNEYKKKISESLKGMFAGDKNPRWNGGYASKNIPMYDTYSPQLEWCEEVRRNSDDPNILEVKCANCGECFMPTLHQVLNRLQVLKGQMQGECRFYCSEECKKACPVYHQVSWPKGYKPDTTREVQPELRQLVLERDDYQCIKCGSTENLQCHHITGVELNPIESADMDNCITLCKYCHTEVHQQDGCGYNDMKRKEC